MWLPGLRGSVCAALLVAAGVIGAPYLRASDAPVLVMGQLIAMDSAALDGLRFQVRAGTHVGSGTVGADGSLEYPLPSGLAFDSLDLAVDAADPADRRYHPALLRLARRDLYSEQRIVLVPRQWRVQAGVYQGQVVEISMERAYRPACPTCVAFLQRGSRLGSGVAMGGVPGWPEDRFPLRVAFDRASSDAAITPRDSTGFWRIADHVEYVTGRSLFRPVPFQQTLAVDEDGPTDVVLVWVVPSLRHPGRGAVAYHRDRITTGVLWLRNTALIFDPQGPSLVTHELMHTLGFGHTCSWRSVMADVPRCPSMRSPVPTREDVAYMEVAQRATTLARNSGARWGMEAALAGEQALRVGALAADLTR
jgi:hypothetical protein